MVAKAPALGSLIDKLEATREKKRKAQEAVDAIEAEFKELEEQVMARLGEEGMDKASGKKATVSISTSVVANIEDFDELCKFVKKTGNFQLFQRRISDPAFRELVELKGKPVPGLAPFERKRLNLRTLKG